MIIKRPNPKYPRRGPSCLLVLFIIIGVGFGMFVIQNKDDAREFIFPTPTPEPTRSATEYALLAEISQDEGEFEEALGYYAEAIRLDASNPEIFIRYINLLVKTGNSEESVMRGEEAVVLAPDNDAVWTAVAQAHLANGERLQDAGDPTAANLEYAKAFQAGNNALDVNPGNATAMALAAGGLVSQGDPNLYLDAQLLAEDALAIEPNNPWAHYYLAEALTNQAYYDAARDHYLLGIQADRTLSELHIGLAYNFFGDGRVSEAILTFQDAIEVDSTNAKAYDGLAYMFLQLGQDVQAEDNALISVELNPNVARAHGRLGEAYMRTNKFDQAIEEFGKAVALYGEATPNNARFFYLLADAYVRAGLENCTQAVPLFQAVSEINTFYAEDAQERLVECRRASLENSP